jgi:hypothetical protein
MGNVTPGQMAALEKKRVSDVTGAIMDRIVANCFDKQGQDLYKMAKKVQDGINKVVNPEEHKDQMDKAVEKLNNMAFGKYSACCVDTWTVGFDPCNDLNSPWALDALHLCYAQAIAPYYSDELPWFLHWVNVQNIITIIEVAGIGILLYLSIDALYAAIIAALVGGTIIIAAAASTNSVGTGTSQNTNNILISFSTASSLNKQISDSLSRIQTNENEIKNQVKVTPLLETDDFSKITTTISGVRSQDVKTNGVTFNADANTGIRATYAQGLANIAKYITGKTALPVLPLPADTIFTIKLIDGQSKDFTHAQLETMATRIKTFLNSTMLSSAAYLRANPGKTLNDYNTFTSQTKFTAADLQKVIGL